MSENGEQVEHMQPSEFKFEKAFGRFVIGASAGLLAGGLGGFIGYEVLNNVLHQTINALPVIGGPALGIGLVYGIRSAKRAILEP